MYASLARPATLGLPCLSIRIAGLTAPGDAERFCCTLGHLPVRQPVRLLVRFDDALAPAGWEPLREALARRVELVRVAFVGAWLGGVTCSRQYRIEDEGAAWSWLLGVVPPSPSWGAPGLLPSVAVPVAERQGGGAVRLPALSPVVDEPAGAERVVPNRSVAEPRQVSAVRWSFRSIGWSFYQTFGSARSVHRAATERLTPAGADSGRNREMHRFASTDHAPVPLQAGTVR